VVSVCRSQNCEIWGLPCRGSIALLVTIQILAGKEDIRKKEPSFLYRLEVPPGISHLLLLQEEPAVSCFVLEKYCFSLHDPLVVC
jgi:hypothetical protein